MANERISIDDAMEFARQRAQQVDGRHGDPQTNGSWIAERKLAAIVLEMGARLRSGYYGPIEVEK